MPLGCVLGIPQPLAGLWPQEHAKQQGSPGHAEGGRRKRVRASLGACRCRGTGRGKGTRSSKAGTAK